MIKTLLKKGKFESIYFHVFQCKVKDPNEACKHYYLSGSKAPYFYFYMKFATISSESEQRKILTCQKFHF